MRGVNSWSAVKVHYENPRGVICDEGVLVVDLCPPGPLCKLDCLWLNPYLFVSLGGWWVVVMRCRRVMFMGLFNQALSDMSISGIAGVHFDVSEGGLVRAGSCLLVSVDTSDGDRFPVTTTARLLTGGSECCGWLQFMTRGRAL